MKQFGASWPLFWSPMSLLEDSRFPLKRLSSSFLASHRKKLACKECLRGRTRKQLLDPFVLHELSPKKNHGYGIRAGRIDVPCGMLILYLYQKRLIISNGTLKKWAIDGIRTRDIRNHNPAL